MNAIDLANQLSHVHAQAATMLVEDFDEPYAWPNLSAAQAEVARVMADGFARAVLDNDLLLGWVGGLPEYGGHVWELHPLVVRRTHRCQGIGRALVNEFEQEASARGALDLHVWLWKDNPRGMFTSTNAALKCTPGASYTVAIGAEHKH